MRVKIDQTLQNMGLYFTENYVRETYGKFRPAEGDKVLTPLSTAASTARSGVPPALCSDPGMNGEMLAGLRRMQRWSRD